MLTPERLAEARGILLDQPDQVAGTFLDNLEKEALDHASFNFSYQLTTLAGEIRNVAGKETNDLVVVQQRSWRADQLESTAKLMKAKLTHPASYPSVKFG